MISYILSSYARGAPMDACLASIAVQRYMTEVIVCCNCTDPAILKIIEGIAARYGHRTVATGHKGCANCYDSANMEAPQARGEWLCFPSDDSLYVADFSRIMVDTAERTDADIVYCDMVYRLGTEVNSWKPYSILESEPHMGKIDKTNFIVRRELFKGFPDHPRNWCDGALIEQLIRDGARPVKAPGVLVIHQ
jgi:GT2 family glycosyltransferase